MKTEEMTMSFEEFTAFMREKVQLVLGTDVIVVSKSVLKNNGTRLQGLEFFKETVRISPVIYLDGIYKEYERGRSMADCVREVCSLYTVNQWEKEKQHASAIIGIAAPLVCLRIFGSGSFLIPSMVCILVALLLFRRPIEAKESEAAK